MDETPNPDQRITWVREAPERKVVQIIEPTGDGFAVTTQWVERGQITRQDCEVAIMRGAAAKGSAQGFLRRLLGGRPV